MCGITGYIGKKKTTEVLLNGLYALEYRGYDSAGVAISDGKNLEIIKSVGRVKELEAKINKEDKLNSLYGIAHTRWATNGEANLVNAHPHKVGKITLVHNGIIENADTLKEELEQKLIGTEEKINTKYKTKEEKELDELIENFLKLEKIDKMYLYRLINKIEIDKDKNAYIFFNFSKLNSINENLDEFIKVEELINK